jgi:3-methylfumaryl-CoA hydratase
MLFKYSAITYNSHRIHYDLNYAREEEGYTDLLVHGPLLATLSLDEFRKNIKYRLTTFKFKMLKPVIVNEKINLKIFKNIKNKKEFKAIISCLKSKEIKFVATYLIK